MRYGLTANLLKCLTKTVIKKQYSRDENILKVFETKSLIDMTFKFG